MTAGLLENDDWQALLRQPSVRKVVEEIQADPAAVRKWGDVPEAMEAMGELRKLQAFCKPRGLKTNVARLVRTVEVTPEAARARAARCEALGAGAQCSAAQGLRPTAERCCPSAAVG